MTHDNRLAVVSEIMLEFAGLTGLTSGRPPRRYLWTDAFAVCNFLELARQTADESYLDLALRLIDQVHRVLGRHREDDPRSGWISGLDEEAGARHPTQGGLRIGKQLNERRPGEPFDQQLEWDRDGQYYHYLTKWMHALNRAGRVTGDATYNRWAIELAQAAHAAFTYTPPSGGEKRMYWKMSIDLSYPLVPSMGQHDPLDGYITYTELQATAPGDSPDPAGPDLQAEIADMGRIIAGKSWVTDDPLGLGGLLSDAYRAAQLLIAGQLALTGLLEDLLAAAAQGLRYYARQNALRLPVPYRLAFRELGLSLGLHAVDRLQGLMERHPERLGGRPPGGRVATLVPFTPLAEEIEQFWLKRSNRETESWTAHRDINMVSLATSLAPDGYLTL